jgi:hypothetical protein
MGHTNDLLDGIEQLLATAGIVDQVADGEVYTSGQTAYSTEGLPDKPDRAVAAYDYTVSDSPNQAISTIGLQLRTRAATAAEERDLRDAIYMQLQGRTNLTFGSVHVIQVRRISTTPMGKDGSERPSSAQTFYLDVNTPPSPFRNQ